MNKTSETQRIATGRESSAVAPQLDGRRILLAEDSPDQQRLIATLLAHAGAKVTLECNGEAAVDAFERRHESYDAVVMDLEMPVLDGIEATRQLRVKGFAGPIVAITAYDSDERRALWHTAGCTAFLRKPYDMANLVNTIQQLC